MSQIEEEKKALFEEVPERKAVLTLAVPTIISQLISVIYNIADTFFVGRTGNPYMVAGVSLALPLFVMTVPFANLCGIGGGSQIARMMGAGEEDQAKSVCAFSLYLSAGLAVLYALIVLVFLRPLLALLGASANTMPFARQYTFTVVVCGSLPVLLSAVLAHLLRNAGYSKQASLGLSGGGILNILLDPLFMFVLFPKGQEVQAAAYATLLSNLAACAYLALKMRQVSRIAPLSLNPRELKSLKREHAKKVIAVGVPSAILPGLFDLSNIVLNHTMAAYGDYALAAIGIAMKVERLPNAIGLGLSQGMLPLVSYNYTSGNTVRREKIIRTTRRMGLICAFSCLLLFQIIARPLAGIFLDTSSAGEGALLTVTYAAVFLRLRALASPFSFMNYQSSFCLQAMGDGRSTLIHSVGRILVFYIPLMLLLNRLFGMNGLAVAVAGGECLGGLLALYLLRRSTKARM